jgi:integrase
VTKTIDTRMMAVVTFFNRWLKIKLGLDAKDWPETHDNDPEPYTDEEAAKLEDASLGEINLLIRTFRQTGCRDMELAHLKDTDFLDSKEICIREKPCSDCKDCRSRGNVWRPKTLKGTRKIPVGDALFAELKERGRGLLFPNDQGSSRRRRSESRLIHLPVEALGALAACNEF